MGIGSNLSASVPRTPVAAAAHEIAVQRFIDSAAAVPTGQKLRLAKPTTNLFRARKAGSAGLDVSGLASVLHVDPSGWADVQGMCTYEDLVAATLPHGFLPKVVPQLRTITLGGAVTGLGIESMSFRNGLPHESVTEMDVLIGTGEVVTTRPGDALFDAFPNSYGSLGYATRLRIDLERVGSHVLLRHVRFGDTEALAEAITQITEEQSWAGEAVDAMDGVAFEPGEYYLTLARWWHPDRKIATSDYTGQQIYYRSIPERETDVLTTADYVWRWDTDWFWCSGAFGAQHPVVRRLWPKRLRRSDTYMRLMALDRRYRLADRADRRAGRPQRERVIQDIEVPTTALGEFLDWFDARVGMRPVWLCPLIAHRTWPTYPMHPGRSYVNVGFWGTVHVGDEAPASPLNRAIEEKVAELGGHKSLYSDAFYDRDEFERLYGVDNLARVKAIHDPDNRFPTLYEKAVRHA